MKKQMRSLIILLALLVLFGGIWAATTWIPGLKTTPTTQPAPIYTSAESLFKTDLTKVSKITLRNQGGEQVFLPEEVTDSSGKKVRSWKLQGYGDDVPFSASAIEEVVNTAGEVVVGQEIAAQATNIAQYGLEEPRATLIVELADGTVHQIRFGNELPSKYYDYATLDDTGRVVSVPSSVGERLRRTPVDYFDRGKVLALDKTQMSQFTFIRKSDQLRLVAETVTKGTQDQQLTEFQVISPVKRAGNATNLTKLLTDTLGVYAEKFIALKPTSLVEYGLDQPSYEFHYVIDGKESWLKLGNRGADGTIFAMTSELPLVFQVRASAFTAIDMKDVELIETFIALNNIADVSHLEVEIGKTRFTSDLQITRDERGTDPGVAFTLNGKNAKILNHLGDSLYTAFYQSIIQIQLAGLDPQANVTSAVKDKRIIFTLEPVDDGKQKLPERQQVVEYAPRDGYTDYVFVDGSYIGGYVNRDVAFYAERPDFKYEGVVVAYERLCYAVDHHENGVFDTSKGYPRQTD